MFSSNIYILQKDYEGNNGLDFTLLTISWFLDFILVVFKIHVWLWQYKAITSVIMEGWMLTSCRQQFLMSTVCIHSPTHLSETTFLVLPTQCYRDWNQMCFNLLGIHVTKKLPTHLLVHVTFLYTPLFTSKKCESKLTECNEHCWAPFPKSISRTFLRLRGVSQKHHNWRHP